METTTIERTTQEQIAALIAELGLTMTAEFVPFSKSRNAKPQENGKPWRSLNWRVTLNRASVFTDGSRPSSESHILTTDYAQGDGHCPAYKASVATLGNRNSIMRDEAIAKECETGRSLVNRRVVSEKIAPPPIADVLHSLVSEAGVLDCSSFEEWASDLGFDADSRKAEAIYRACLDIALKLRNGLGEANLRRLQEAFQDY